MWATLQCETQDLEFKQILSEVKNNYRDVTPCSLVERLPSSGSMSVTSKQTPRRVLGLLKMSVSRLLADCMTLHLRAVIFTATTIRNSDWWNRVIQSERGYSEACLRNFTIQLCTYTWHSWHNYILIHSHTATNHWASHAHIFKCSPSSYLLALCLRRWFFRIATNSAVIYLKTKTISLIRHPCVCVCGGGHCSLVSIENKIRQSRYLTRNYLFYDDGALQPKHVVNIKTYVVFACKINSCEWGNVIVVFYRIQTQQDAFFHY
jgi:hypothetical protein